MDAVEIPLTKGYAALVDADEAHMVTGKWAASVRYRADGSVRTVYAVQDRVTAGKRKRVMLHRLLEQAPDHLMVDHRDGNGLNNRKSNRRLATNAQNQHNQGIRCDNMSGAKGVSFCSRSGKWRAEIYVAQKKVYLGLHPTVDAARAAYADASRRLHGEFSNV